MTEGGWSWGGEHTTYRCCMVELDTSNLYNLLTSVTPINSIKNFLNKEKEKINTKGYNPQEPQLSTAQGAGRFHHPQDSKSFDPIANLLSM